MAKGETKIASTLEDIEKVLDVKTKITGGYILDKFIKPRPNDVEGKVVMILQTKDDDGKLGPIKIVKNPSFKTNEAAFMTVAEINHPDIELQLGMGKSDLNAMTRMLNSEGWTLEDLPGKTVRITANYYTKVGAPKCSKCNGKGCAACENTGYSTVFNWKAVKNSPTKDTTKKVVDEF